MTDYVWQLPVTWNESLVDGVHLNKLQVFTHNYEHIYKYKNKFYKPYIQTIISIMQILIIES